MPWMKVIDLFILERYLFRLLVWCTQVSSTLKKQVQGKKKKWFFATVAEHVLEVLNTLNFNVAKFAGAIH